MIKSISLKNEKTKSIEDLMIRQFKSQKVNFIKNIIFF